MGIVESRVYTPTTSFILLILLDSLDLFISIIFSSTAFFALMLFKDHSIGITWELDKTGGSVLCTESEWIFNKIPTWFL